MKYLIPLALTLALGGCASVPKTFSLNALNDVEQGLRVAVAGANAYKRLCDRRALPDSCVGVVVKLRGYSRQSRPLLARLRVFVKSNDQINAFQVLIELNGIISQAKQTLAEAPR